MSTDDYKHWLSNLKDSHKRPAYLMIADLIAADIESGVLQARDRLPPIRDLAKLLSLNYTTVVRGFKEASNRGLIDAHPGSGSFVKGTANAQPLRGGSDIEMTMNLPPEPRDTELLNHISNGFDAVKSLDSYGLFRYQDFGGTYEDKEAAIKFLAPLIPNATIEQTLVCPGIHSILVALLSMLTQQGGTICTEDLVYPGLKAIAAQLGITLNAIDSDGDGPRISSLEALCKSEKVAAIYLNPTLQNPSTRTISQHRRQAIADVALRYSIPIIEDDPYGPLIKPSPEPVAIYAPELTYYISGLSKCFGAGLRIAYLYTPSKLLAQRTAGALRSLSVMASPVTTSLSTQWVNDGTVEQMIDAIRAETHLRFQAAKKHLAAYSVYGHNDGFHLWLKLPKKIDINPSIVAAHLRSQGVSAVSSAAFCANNNPPHALRLCMGGAVNRNGWQEALHLVADILEHPSHLSGIGL